MRFLLDDYREYTDEENKIFTDQALATLLNITSTGYLDLRRSYQMLLDYGFCGKYEVGDYLADMMWQYADEHKIPIHKIDAVSLVADKCAYTMRDYIRNITNYEPEIISIDWDIMFCDENEAKYFIEYLQDLDKDELIKIRDNLQKDNPLNEKVKDLISDGGFDIDDTLKEYIDSYSNSQDTKSVKRQR